MHRSDAAVPTYQYVCTSPEDKHEFEVVQSFSDPSLTACAQCGNPVRKVSGSVGVVFKGSGFYHTDSRAKSSSDAGTSNGAKKESGGDGSATTSSSTAAGSSPSASSTRTSSS